MQLEHIACQRCSNYIFILDSTPGFNGLGKDNCKTRWETSKFRDLVHLILRVLTVFLFHLDSSNPQNAIFTFKVDH